MKKILLIDDKPIFHWLWKRGIRRQFTFLHAYTTRQAKQLFAAHSDIVAVVVDACMDGPLGISLYAPVYEWGFNTGELIQNIRGQFNGPIIASPSQWWHFEQMRLAGCTHHCWKWRVPYLLKKLLST